MGLELKIAPEVAGRARLGLLLAQGVTVREAHPALAACCAELRTRYGEGRSAEVPGAANATPFISCARCTAGSPPAYSH